MTLSTGVTNFCVHGTPARGWCIGHKLISHRLAAAGLKSPLRNALFVTGCAISLYDNLHRCRKQSSDRNDCKFPAKVIGIMVLMADGLSFHHRHLPPPPPRGGVGAGRERIVVICNVCECSSGMHTCVTGQSEIRLLISPPHHTYCIMHHIIPPTEKTIMICLDNCHDHMVDICEISETARILKRNSVTVHSEVRTAGLPVPPRTLRNASFGMPPVYQYIWWI